MSDLNKVEEFTKLKLSSEVDLIGKMAYIPIRFWWKKIKIYINFSKLQYLQNTKASTIFI
jgi:translation elongation factor EF-1beta